MLTDTMLFMRTLDRLFRHSPLLSLCTTLTPATTFARIQGPTIQRSSVLSGGSAHHAVYGIHSNNHAEAGLQERVVDIASPAVSGALDRLAAVVRHQQQQQQVVGNATTELEDVLVKVHAPLFVHVAPRGVKASSSSSQATISSAQSHSQAYLSSSSSFIHSNAQRKHQLRLGHLGRLPISMDVPRRGPRPK